jgi:hypothetical protein
VMAICPAIGLQSQFTYEQTVATPRPLEPTSNHTRTRRWQRQQSRALLLMALRGEGQTALHQTPALRPAAGKQRTRIAGGAESRDAIWRVKTERRPWRM